VGEIPARRAAVVIRFDAVSKVYRIGAGHTSMREGLALLPRSIFGGRSSSGAGRPELWALRDVSFSVEPGETLGLVGRNGAGKTTALKLLSKITQPSAGRVTLHGRVAALIELGAGFHPDLTGRENVFLYGAILGIKRRQINERLDKIVEFAELERFMDTPVKRYSSGMYARLAFSVAAHTYPDVLLVDEVLSVGDSNFRAKCLDFIHSFVNSGKTTIFVSHDAWAVEQLCNRLIWLDQGRIMQAGNPSRVLEQYLEFLEHQATDASHSGAEDDLETGGAADQTIHVRRVRLSDGRDTPRTTFACGEDVVVDVEYQTNGVVERPHFCVWVSDTPAPDPLFAANMLVDGDAPTSIAGEGTLRCVFRRVPLMPRAYYVWVEVWGADRAKLLYKWRRLTSFRVVAPELLAGVEDRPGAVHFTKLHGPIRVDYEWSMPVRQPTGAELSARHG
jgi:lipopolysaccharide transport system ATP-binding protein